MEMMNVQRFRKVRQEFVVSTLLTVLNVIYAGAPVMLIPRRTQQPRTYNRHHQAAMLRAKNVTNASPSASCRLQRIPSCLRLQKVL